MTEKRYVLLGWINRICDGCDLIVTCNRIRDNKKNEFLHFCKDCLKKEKDIKEDIKYKSPDHFKKETEKKSEEE